MDLVLGPLFFSGQFARDVSEPSLFFFFWPFLKWHIFAKKKGGGGVGLAGGNKCVRRVLRKTFLVGREGIWDGFVVVGFDRVRTGVRRQLLQMCGMALDAWELPGVELPMGTCRRCLKGLGRYIDWKPFLFILVAYSLPSLAQTRQEPFAIAIAHFFTHTQFGITLIAPFRISLQLFQKKQKAGVAILKLMSLQNYY